MTQSVCNKWRRVGGGRCGRETAQWPQVDTGRGRTTSKNMQTHQEHAADWVDRSSTLMAWAVTEKERKATYIGSLQREQTGLKCDCVCPACGGRLQAVNAGKPIQALPGAKTLRPHFRHDAGQEYDRYLIQVSQLVDLQLLVQKKEIYLPAQTVSFPVVAANNTHTQNVSQASTS